MIILTNQTTYKCSYCNRRRLSKHGMEQHEAKYCRDYNSPHQQSIRAKQAQCTHEHTETQYRYIPGEAVQEPDYELCFSCGKHIRK